jgi:GDP/UDP-N,N'-diacetylbacillosamine 2-epimerase (hydrolysing)
MQVKIMNAVTYFSLSKEPLKVCVVTGSRSEYGLMCSLMQDLKNHDSVDLKIIVTGSHLSETFGHTYREIEADGFTIDKKIPGLLDTGSDVELTKTVGVWTGQFAETFEVMSPDLVLVMGDRYELLAVHSACILLSIPLGHISGGEITEGAIDDQIRHSLTKASHFHFVANEIYGDRVRQMGEEDWRVCVSGEPGLDALVRTSTMSVDELSQDLDIDLHRPTALVTFHPATLDSTPIDQQMRELFLALNDVNLQYVITYPNADVGSEIIIRHIQDFAEHNKQTVVVRKSLGHHRYVSLLRIATLMIGNSSSGLVEAPAFNLPVVNIGTRQEGRMRSNNVIDVDCIRSEIIRGLEWAQGYDRTGYCPNPYGDGNSSGRIIEFILYNFIKHTRDEILRKRFCDLNFRKVIKPIGSHFEIDANSINRTANPDWTKRFHLDENTEFVGSGRSAFCVIMAEIQLKDKVILMPDYLCGEAQIPVLKQQGINYQYYPVSENLTISPEDVISLLTPETGAVLMINYFGLRDHFEVASKIRAYNPDIQIIEDNSQAFYGMANQTPEEHWADFSFSSFLKSFAIPDGGCVRSKHRLKSLIVEPSSRQGVAYLLGGMIKHEYLNPSAYNEANTYSDVRYLELFDKASKEVPESSVRMTALSHALLERYPLEDWVQCRRKNYRFLMDALKAIPQVCLITDDLQSAEVPLFLPIRVAATDRNGLRDFLRQQQIYCPVHWPLIPELDNLEHHRACELSQTILSLPIDHRLDFIDLERLVQSIISYWRNKNE